MTKRKLNWAKKYAPQNWIYETNNDNTARFVLGTDGKNPLVCFGINPSTACPSSPDSTLIRVEKYAYCHGFDSWIMLNIYPQRATEPKNLHKVLDKDLHGENIVWIEKILMRQQLQIWAAWGDAISSRKYLQKCLDDIEIIINKYNSSLMKLELTTKGNPCHPLCRREGFSLYSTSLTAYSENKIELYT